MGKLLLITTITFTFLACKQQGETDYSAIENGLIPAVLIGDSAALTYSVAERMKHYRVPGASIAVFKNGEIVWHKTYGLTEAGSGNKIDLETRFQAASISKAVTGLGVLRLVEDHGLDLDADINKYLRSWQIESPFLDKEKVSIRTLLTHTAGTTVSGVMGQEKSGTIPGTTDVLNGKGDIPPVKLDTVPGARFFYSGGGFLILQQLIEDVSGLAFKDYFEENVFPALEMSNSTFDQLPGDNVSSGHDWEGIPNPNGWRVFPAMAAAGLWTTPSDLARFCIAIENAYYGEKHAFISHEMAKEMLTPIKNRGLGVALDTTRNEPYFFHGGSNPGDYRCFMVDAYHQRAGIVIMTNAAQGRRLQEDILRSFSNFFQINIMKPRHIQPVNPGRDELEKFTGNYQLKEALPYPLSLSANSENQLVLYDPNDGMKNIYLPLNDTAFIEINDGSIISFRRTPRTGKIKSMNFSAAYTFYKVE